MKKKVIVEDSGSDSSSSSSEYSDSEQFMDVESLKFEQDLEAALMRINDWQI